MRRDLSKLDSATQEAIGEFTDPNKPTYPRDKKTVTSSGHVWELDDTLGKETINLRHGPTGSYFKMMPNGDIQIHSPTNNVNIIAAKNVEIKTIGEKVYIDLDDKLYSFYDYNLNHKIYTFIDRFDMEYGVDPFEFELEVR